MKISAEKMKLMTNSTNGIQREIKVKEQKLGMVPRRVVSDHGSKPEIQGLHKPLQLLHLAEANFER